MAKSVQTLLEDIRLLGEEQFQIVEAVRTLVKKTVKPVTEEVKYGGIMFASGVPFSGVFAYQEHVSVEFGHGAKIDGMQHVLEGSGKGRRHIKLYVTKDISTKQLAALLPLALAAAKSGA
jgi:hypothetical protein